ncbi:hypothetical protein RDWZM_009104 [Blomia tropicalis]|uniref:DUF4209 domain-containing protein n=1 Tax=Blomia tropicalis TaxID=40697 RepID=A0A9Q0M4T4_BLOTA|nr:hypothetical protein RDWZM_009104 [Blomia tropicalis]
MSSVFDPIHENLNSDILNSDLSFNYEQLDIELNHLLTTKDVSYEAELIDEMKDYLISIVPIINHVYNRFHSIVSIDGTGQQLLNILEPNLYWTGNWKLFLIDSITIACNYQQRLFHETFSDEKMVRDILALHIITSGLEQTLGNLVLTQSHFVPPLLKVLLTMPELENLIGIRLIRLLKTIVGPPITVNLRNILWHGFVNCTNHSSQKSLSKIDYSKFYYFLLAIVVSIGVNLKSNLLKLNEIPQRKLYNFDEFADRIQNLLDPIELDYVYFKNLVNQCPAIHHTLKPLWLAAIDMIFHSECSSFQNYSFCLLLPLLESNLRFLYCSLNGLSDRLLTAISHEYYVTFTEILSFDSLSEEEIVKGTELNKVELKNQNKLYHFLPKPLMIQLLDMIIFPEENIINFILIRSDEFDRCLLRSRQRSNFQTFQEKFPELINSLRNLFSYFEKWYQNLKFLTQQWNQESSVFEKSMKHLLKIAENVAQLSSITKNRWDKIMTLVNDQDQLLKTTDTLFYENFI